MGGKCSLVQHHHPGDKSVPTVQLLPCPLGVLIVPEQKQSLPEYVDFSTDTGFVQEVAAAP